MTTTLKRTAAAFLAGTLAFGFTHRGAMAHSNHQGSLVAGGLTGAYYDTLNHRTLPFVCVTATLAPDNAHVAPGHGHTKYVRITTASGRLAVIAGRSNPTGAGSGADSDVRYIPVPDWQTTYTLQLQTRVYNRTTRRYDYTNVGNAITVTTGAQPSGTESDPTGFCRTGTPTTPTTPTEPETPTTTGHSHALPAHTHSYAAAQHSHATQVHTHPYAAAQHVHESTAQEHTHDTAPEHNHDEVPEHTHEPADPETPGPETPEEPETPGPVAETCTYQHRFTGVPGTTANAYIGQIRISSEQPNATATIRAYQSDNGHRIDVLDAEGHAVETVSLVPARSVKRFRIEAIRGWHPVTVEHPSESAMTAASVAMRLREPGGSIEDSYPPGIKHCEPATGPVTETGTTAPDLAVRDAQALLWTATLDWRATVENIGDGPAPKTSIRLYYGERELAAQDVRQALAPGAQWPMSHAVNRSAVTVPRAGSRVRVCVDPVPGEPESKRANNCATVTVESN